MFEKIIKQLNRLFGVEALSADMTEAEVLNHLEDMAAVTVVDQVDFSKDIEAVLETIVHLEAKMNDMIGAMAAMQSEMGAVKVNNDHIIAQLDSMTTQLTAAESQSAVLATELNTLKASASMPSIQFTTAVPAVPSTKTATAVQSNLLTERLKGMKISKFQIN